MAGPARGAGNALLGIISGIAVKSRKHTAGNSIWKHDQDSMLVCFRESPFKNEFDDLMEKLSTTVCNNILWGWNSELLHVCIRKAIRQLK